MINVAGQNGNSTAVRSVFMNCIDSVECYCSKKSGYGEVWLNSKDGFVCLEIPKDQLRNLSEVISCKILEHDFSL